MANDRIIPGGWVDEFVNTPYREIRQKQTAKKTPHKKAINDIVKTLHKLPGAKRIEIRNVGMGEFQGRKYSFGHEGESDLRMTWKPTAWPYPMPISIAIEVKVGRDRQRPAQKVWQDRWEETGAVYWICGEGTQAWELCMNLWRQLLSSHPLNQPTSSPLG